MARLVRAFTAQEAEALKHMAHSRTAPHRVVQRAQIIWARAHGGTGPVMAPQVGLSAVRVRAWIQRVHRDGLAGGRDAPRSGRPRPHDEARRGTVVALAHPKPRRLGLPVARWTLGRLQQALPARHRLPVTPATMWQWLHAEGVVWKRQQRWFQVIVEAAFGEPRGRSSRPTRSPSRRAGSAASTSWAR
jgi:transposase